MRKVISFLTVQLLTALTLILTSSGSLAQANSSLGESRFRQFIEATSLRLSFKALSPEELSQLSPIIQSRLGKVAEEMSRIWGDTILEGDYFSEETPRLDQVELIYLDEKQFVGYRITYSAKAFHTANCEYSLNDLSTLASCLEGRIQEKAFVSSSLRSFFQEEESAAQFLVKE